MGRINELLEKKKAGDISEVELKELDELQSEAKAAVDSTTKTEEEEEKAIDDLADKLANAASDRLEKGLAAVLKKMEDRQAPQLEVVHEAKFIVDPKLGRKSIDELSEIKVALPGREDKKVKEVSLKTSHFIGALMDNNVQKLQLLTEGSASGGGYLVPEEFANMIVEDIRDLVVMRQIADVMTTTSDTLHLPSLATRPKATFRSEAAVKNTSTVQFGENVFTPYSLAVIVGLSNELVADATLGVNGSIINYVSQLMSRSLAEREETAFWIGNGSAQPTGIDNYTYRTVASGGTDANRADALIQAYIRTPQGYRSRAVWAMNSATMEKVHTLKDSNGNYLLSRLGDGLYPTIKGRPVYEVNDLAGGKAFFGDFSYYKIVDREGIAVRVSDEATVAGSSGFEKNLTFIRVEKRVDAEMTLTEPMTEVSGLGNA